MAFAIRRNARWLLRPTGLPETTAGDASIWAERVREAVAASAIEGFGPKPIRVTCSLGVAATSGTDATLEDLLKRADKALYAAKNAGRNRVSVALE